MEKGFLDKVEENEVIQTWFETTQWKKKVIVWPKDMYQSRGTSLVLV
ncbi:hypothetical protein Goshw_014779 [Gossypium schwendimanii]|uniref:Uncharacterized protein n=1 Tax=Gossypium schwendimanii TaxID=34291 RepID=A0A7J9N1E0_GOSSC|nr:hypothetical protein [Gossypium schwendimanii]